MKQTAVEWLVEKLDQNFDYVADTIIQQAKEMEKEQMIEMHDKGFDSVVQLNDEYAVGFADWLEKSGYLMCLIRGSKPTNKLLEIYKKENL